MIGDGYRYTADVNQPEAGAFRFFKQRNDWALAYRVTDLPDGISDMEALAMIRARHSEAHSPVITWGELIRPRRRACNV
jgi:hypothetical protein